MDPFEPRTITITKLEAARRQLATAIELWFRDGDPVSIHALAFAAHEIIHVIFRRRGGPGLLFSYPIIKEEHRKEFNILIKTAANFIKHAKDDWEASLEFNATAGLSFIVASTMGLSALNETLTLAETIFITYARFHWPNWFTNDITDYGIPANMVPQIRSLSKSEFYQAITQSRRNGQWLAPSYS